MKSSRSLVPVTVRTATVLLVAVGSVLAAAWGAWDGRHRRLGTVALTWLATGVVVGAVALLRVDWGVPRSVWLTDLPILPTMIAGPVLVLVLVPVLVPALVVASVVSGVRGPAEVG